MAEVKGDRLYVHLSASQTRRRLKRFGHGVRKVQSAGKNQAVIIHTATRRHLEELKSLFADAAPSTSPADMGVPIENLRNLGPASAAALREVGIVTLDDLRRLGPAGAYRLVEFQRPGVGHNLLWALAAALDDRDPASLSDEEKWRLLAEAEGE